MDSPTVFLSPLAFLGFGSPWYLLWGLAIAIPILLHLWKQRSRQEHPWAAMRFLEEALEQSHRSSRFEHWLLLLLRCLALLGVAFAVARPWMQTNRESLVSPDQPPRLLVVAIDCSYSMQHRSGSEDLFAIAKRNALARIEQLRKSDAVVVIGIGSQVEPIIPVGSFDHELVRREIRAIAVEDSIADASAALPVIEEAVTRSKARHPQLQDVELVICSDFARNSWGKVGFEHWKEALSASNSEVVIHAMSSIESGQSFLNFGIPKMKLVDVPRIGQKCEFELEIERFGDGSKVPNVPRSIAIQLIVDGKVVASRTVELESQSVTHVRLAWIPDREGLFSIAAKIEDDSLLADNTRWQTVEVRRKRKVLILEQQFEAGKYIQVALASDESNAKGMEIVRKRIGRNQPLELANQDVVILADVTFQDSNQWKSLYRFVEQGGGLMVWSGPNTVSTTWNSNAGLDGLRLPFAFNKISDNATPGIDPRDYLSSVVAPFRDFPKSGLLTTPIYKYWSITVSQASSIDVDLGLAGDQPLLFHHSFGKGMIYWMLTSPVPKVEQTQEEWNALAGWPSFVPLANEVHWSLIGHASRQTEYLVGQAIRGDVQVSYACDWTIQFPNGTKQKQALTRDRESNQWEWSIPHTRQQGLYEVSFEPSSNGELREGAAPVPEKIRCAVNVDVHESQQDWLSDQELPNELRRIQEQGNSAASSPEIGKKSDSIAMNYGTADLFRWGLASVLICLIFESTLAGFMKGRGR